MSKTYTPAMAKRLRPLTILSGSHQQDAHKFCIMEAVSYIADEPFSDEPVCVSDMITQFMMSVNDTRPSNQERNKLKKVVPEIIGTRPTQTTKEERVNAQGERVVIKVELPKHTKGYIKAEERRGCLLTKELTALGVSVDDSYPESPSYDAMAVSTKDAINIAKKLAAVKNKA